MIIVIADDFTGAAEIAVISLGYGLKVSLCMGELVEAEADVLIVSTESRSMPPARAVEVVERVTRRATALNPDYIYKKIDSVLRGHVAAELQWQLEALGRRQALIVPANPSLHRIIVQGHYYVNGLPINETAFARDPEFAITSSAVNEMFQAPCRVLSRGAEMTPGLLIAEAASLEDMAHWAARVDRSCLAAGSGDFFDALLQRQYRKRERQPGTAPQQPHLYVSGTSFTKPRALIKAYGSGDTAYISAAMVRDSALADWLDRVGGILAARQQLIIAFDESIDGQGFEAADLRALMADCVNKVLIRFDIREVLIEGGATAAAIFQVLGLQCFEPVYEWERGVVKMKAGDFVVTVKPGSYELSEALKQQYHLFQHSSS